MPRRVPTHRGPGHALSSRATVRTYESQAARREDKAFYASTTWRELRRLFLLDHPLCADCDREGRLVRAEHVHHKAERKERPDLALDWENLEALCAPCHNQKRRRT